MFLWVTLSVFQTIYHTIQVPQNKSLSQKNLGKILGKMGLGLTARQTTITIVQYANMIFQGEYTVHGSSHT